MKLLKVKINNFRILRNVELEFSIDNKKNLTVIRAENATGKTTMLDAIIWGFFGFKNSGKSSTDYRLHPLDWDTTVSEQVPVEIEINFSNSSTINQDNGQTTEENNYKLIRSITETITEHNSFSKGQEFITLLLQTDEGWKKLPNPESTIKQIMGTNVKDLFFTNGDDALSFITSFSTTRRKKVKSAIRDMLSFEMIENAINHVKKNINYLQKNSQSFGGSAELEKIGNKLQNQRDSLENFEDQKYSLENQLEAAIISINNDQKDLEEILKSGYKDKLSKELESIRKTKDIYKAQKSDLEENHAKFFMNNSIHSVLLSRSIQKTSELLTKLNKQGKIPKTSIPYLRDLIINEKCICTRELKQGGDFSKIISQIINEQDQNSDLDERVNNLRYKASERSQDLIKFKETWNTKLLEIIKTRIKINDELADLKGEEKRLLNQIDELPDSDVQLVRDNIKTSEQIRDRLQSDLFKIKQTISLTQTAINELSKNFDELHIKDQKSKELAYKLKASKDIMIVLENTYKFVEGNEIPEVSKYLGNYFLEMIKSSREDSRTIRQAFVNEEYEIIVLGINDQNLDTVEDLNGASRRALTFAFILALTKVSGVNSPNMIDTPLGMMSPEIKSAVLDVSTRESSQLILFLTRSEINDIEEVIDKKAGKIITLTNSDHYPDKLVNKPSTKYNEVITCDCSHRQFCDKCNRISDEKNNKYKYRA
jgi:DNA sulfur modification protein DndD